MTEALIAYDPGAYDKEDLRSLNEYQGAPPVSFDSLAEIARRSHLARRAFDAAGAATQIEDVKEQQGKV